MDMKMTSTARNISNNMVTRNGMDTIKSKVSCNSKKLQLLPDNARDASNSQIISNSMVTSHDLDTSNGRDASNSLEHRQPTTAGALAWTPGMDGHQQH
jgi:hypothetical protein